MPTVGYSIFEKLKLGLPTEENTESTKILVVNDTDEYGAIEHRDIGELPFVPLAGTKPNEPITGVLKVEDIGGNQIESAGDEVNKGGIYLVADQVMFNVTDDDFNTVKTVSVSPEGLSANELFQNDGSDPNQYVQNGHLKNTPYINVKDFGAVGDGVNDDTEEIQAAINFCVANQKEKLYFPSGTYLITQVITNGKIYFYGNGVPSLGLDPENEAYLPFVPSGSTVISKSPNLDCIVSNAPGTSFKDIAVWYQGETESTKTGVKLENAGSFVSDNLQVNGFDTNLEIYNGTRWSITSSNFFFPRNRGIYIHSSPILIYSDTGDTSISGCNIVTNKNGVTGIRYEGNGGLKIVNTKINPSDSTRLGIALDGYFTGTSSILLVANNSFEGFSGRAIKLTTDGTHSFDNVIIDGNQMESYSEESYLTGVTCIEVQGQSETIRNVLISGNTIKRTGATSTVPAILINDVVRADIYDNQIEGFATPVTITSTPYVYKSIHSYNDITTVDVLRVPFNNGTDTDVTRNIDVIHKYGNETKEGVLKVISSTNFFPMQIGGSGGTNIFALGNYVGKPSIQGLTDTDAITEVSFQPLGGKSSFGGVVNVSSNDGTPTAVVRNEDLPNSVMFSANRGTSRVLATGEHDLLCNSVEFEIGGSNYNSTTGVFTAPTDGIYSFTTSVYLGSAIASAGWSGIDVVSANANTVNGKYKFNNIANTSQVFTVGGSVEIRLNAGDTVKAMMYASVSTGTLDIGHTTNSAGKLGTRFSGKLIHKF